MTALERLNLLVGLIPDRCKSIIFVDLNNGNTVPFDTLLEDLKNDLVLDEIKTDLGIELDPSEIRKMCLMYSQLKDKNIPNIIDTLEILKKKSIDFDIFNHYVRLDSEHPNEDYGLKKYNSRQYECNKLTQKEYATIAEYLGAQNAKAN